MANKRMFTMKIVDSDAFLDMPLSAQCLYFHLNMRADDDGFIGNPKRVAKIINASDDDLKLLIAKRFVLPFDNGVIVIKHWRMHNTLQKDRYTETQYLEEKAQLLLKDNGAYSFTSGKPINDSKYLLKKSPDNSLLTDCSQHVIPDIDIDKDLDSNSDKDSDLGEDEEDDVEPKAFSFPSSSVTLRKEDLQRIVEAWNGIGLSRIVRITTDSERYRMLKARVKEYGVDAVIEAIRKIPEQPFLMGEGNKGWTINFEWLVKPNNFPKVLEGNYMPHTAQERPQGNKVEQRINNVINSIWEDE